MPRKKAKAVKKRTKAQSKKATKKASRKRAKALVEKLFDTIELSDYNIQTPEQLKKRMRELFNARRDEINLLAKLPDISMADLVILRMLKKMSDEADFEMLTYFLEVGFSKSKRNLGGTDGNGTFDDDDLIDVTPVTLFKLPSNGSEAPT